MTNKEIAARIIEVVRAYELRQLRGFDAATAIEQLVDQLVIEDRHTSEQLKLLCLRLAFWDHAPMNERPRAAISEIRQIAQQLSE